MTMWRDFLFSIAIIFTVHYIGAQGCCSGGGGNPLTGATVAGVLQKGELELMNTYQYSRSNRFLSKDSDTIAFFDNLSSNYIFFKADYGITDKLTMSVGGGYYLNRTITEFADTSFVGTEMRIEQNQINSSGLGDLILFPKYCFYNKTKGVNRTEISLGLGWKIPIGSNADSNFVGYSVFPNLDDPANPFLDSTEIWAISPPTIQTTTGSHDLMAYGFFFKSFPNRKLRVFANALYVRTGWNSLGLKFGDYANVGLFVGTTLWKKLSLTGQLSGEWVGKMKTNELIDPLAAYSIDTISTGSRKVSFVPQISYNFKGGISLFAFADVPIYQYMRGTQIAAQHQITAGVSYRFNTDRKRKTSQNEIKLTSPETQNKEESFKVWGKCGMCKEKIEKITNTMSGVSYANWNLEELVLTVQYDKTKVNKDEIKIELAKAGYDSETHKATDRAYKNLHSCCKYERD